MRTLAATAVASTLFALPCVATARTIHVTPADGYAPIESAAPGDEVLIAPGTYAFRVYLTQTAPASNPIVIRAEDPTHPPVWDLGSTLVENAPGSYTAGDRGRGCWQFSGATNIHVSGIVLTNCHNAAHNSAGVRYYNTSLGIELSDVVFRGNDNGLTGGTQDSEITVSFCEFDANGSLSAPASAPSHNIYIYGGTFTLRYSYVHDPVQSQNFHIRSRVGLIEYNWFARARSYEGDLMTSDDYVSGPYAQSLTLRGNVIVQSAAPANHGQVIAVFNDAGATGLSLSVRLVQNTFVGSGLNSALVHLSNADGTTMSAEISNNVISGTNRAYLVETAAAATVTGTNNWLPSGSSAPALSATVNSASPGFTAPATVDFVPGAGSVLIGAASAAVTGLPTQEYFRDETMTRMYRVRATAHDIGAFESTTTGAGIGPYGPPTGVDGGVSDSGADATVASDAGGSDAASIDAGSADVVTSDSGRDAARADALVPDGGLAVNPRGCGCRVERPRSRASFGWAVLCAVAVVARRRRRQSRSGRGAE